MSQVNPTPWHVSACPCGDAECGEYEAGFGSVFDADDVALDMSDAQTLKLIAAAPELLDCVEDCLKVLQVSSVGGLREQIIECQAVIEKARGES